jgi:uncharacterized protein YbgA (DUF1722 family)/uncharacterized protein YbbK (DUF523 family)
MQTSKSSEQLDSVEEIVDSAPRIGISQCILGDAVRYDRGHKLDRFVRDTLGEFVSFVPVCPEVELGLGVPRETLRLVRGSDGESRMIANKSQTDHTKGMLAFAKKRCRELEKENLCGYIVQKGSPSCGMERVRVYAPKGGSPAKDGRGLFTATLMEHFPDLPVEEDGRLHDPRLRENFIERIFAYQRLRELFSGRWTVGKLVAFHSREKLLLMAHDRPAYTALGRLVANAKQVARKEVVEQYRTTFLTGLKKIATTRKHTNVLQHMLGFFKKTLDKSDRAELLDAIEQYHAQRVPLVVPMTLFRHHIRRVDVPYLAQQSYLQPHPRELMLRNHV